MNHFANIKTVIIYANEDKIHLNKLLKHINYLERNGSIQIWHKGKNDAGTDIELATETALNEAQIILLLVSVDFLASDNCYKNANQAVELYEQHTAILLPIIARSCIWQHAPFGYLPALPASGSYLNSPKWETSDAPYLEIAQKIENLVAEIEQATHTAINGKKVPSFKEKTHQYTQLIHQANEAFGRKEWQQGIEKYQNALKYYEPGFQPTKTSIQNQVKIGNIELSFDKNNLATLANQHIQATQSFDIRKALAIEQQKYPDRFDAILLPDDVVAESQIDYLFWVDYRAITLSKQLSRATFPLNGTNQKLLGRLQPHLKQNIERDREHLIKTIVEAGDTQVQRINKHFSEVEQYQLAVDIDRECVYYLLTNSIHNFICDKCNGSKYISCTNPACGGRHRWACPQCKGTGKEKCKRCFGRKSVICHQCRGKGNIQQQQQLVRCPTCQGHKRLVCSTCQGHGRTTCKVCYGSEIITCPICYGDDLGGRLGKKDCDRCETTGTLSEFTYLEMSIDKPRENLVLRLENGQFKKMKKPNFLNDIIPNSANIPIDDFKRTYLKINDLRREGHDQFTKSISTVLRKEFKISAHTAYPLLLGEHIYYQLVPVIKIAYSSLFDAKKRHFLRFIKVDDTWQTHWDNIPEKTAYPTLPTYKNLLGRALSLRKYLRKEDKKREVIVMMHLAKDDKKINIKEKRHIAQIVGDNFSLFTAAEQSYLMDLLQTDDLPNLKEQEARFSSTKVLPSILDDLMELQNLSNNKEQAKKRYQKIKEKIEKNTPNRPPRVRNFVTTWQISLPTLLLLGVVVFSLIQLL